MKKVLLSLGLIIAMLFQFNDSMSQVFPGSSIANSSQELVMKNWLGNNPGGTLLYRKSRDGANSYTFHQLCDNQGPTVVLIKTNAGTTFGGYASESWGSNYNYYYGSYIQANGSFLFNLTSSQKFDKGGYSGSTNPYGMYSSNDYGPTFGGGHDLYIQNDMQGGYVNIGHSYNTVNGYSQGSQQAVEALVGPGMNMNYYGNSFQPGFIVDIEVYKVTFNYSDPIVLGRNITRYLDATGQVTINTAMIDSASNDPDGIASISIDKTTFDCSNVGGGSIIPITYLGQQYQETRSHGGGFNPNTNQFYYPEWSGSTVYVYDINHNYVSNFYTGQNEMMQLWMEAGSNDYYTANWSYQSITKRNGSNTVWTYNGNALMSGVSSDANYVYAIGQDYYYSSNNARKIIVLNKSTGVLVREIPLPGDVYTYGGLVIANNHIYIAGTASGFSSIPNDHRAIHVFNMDGSYVSSTQMVEYPYNMAYDGETMWISANSNAIYGYKISNGNTYTNSGSGSTVRLTVVDVLGNTAFKDYYVQLRDTIIPSITLNGNAIEVAPFGGPYIEPGVTALDNCPKPVTITGTVDVNNKGIYSLSYIMKDAGGNNSNTLTRTVYVGAYDTTAPTALAKNITLVLDNSGVALLNYLDINNGSFDANGLKNKSISKTKFDCSNIGTNVVTLTVEDYYGHTSTATSIVTVVYQPEYTLSQSSSCVEGPTGTATIQTSGVGAAGKYYGTRGAVGGGTLITFDPTTGATTTIGNTGINQIPAVAVSPINGNIYATNGQGSFYQLDPNTGVATYIGYMGACSNVAALAFNAQGVLYGNDACGYLFTVNLSTGQVSNIGSSGYWFSGMQFDPTDGSLWATNRSEIYKVNVNTASINYVGYTNYGSISDLVFSSAGVLYAIVGGGGNSQILSINKNNGIGTFVTSTISNIAGASRGGSGLSYLWSNGQTTATATNLDAGTYTVTITSGTGCSKTDTVVFTQCVPVPPVVSITATSEELCEGSSATLTASAVAGVGANVPSSTILPSGLVGYWKFDEGSGTTVADQTSNGLNGTFVGSNLNWANATVFSGSNSQLQFNGGGYVEVQNNSVLNSMSSSFTIESWVYQTDYDNNTIVDRGNYNFLFQVKPNGNQGLGFYNYNIGWYTSGTEIQLYQWTHVAVSYNANTHYLKFYKNGVLTDNFYIPNTLYFDNGPLNIGRQSPNSCQCNIMNGSIDELRIWNTTRTDAEIAANMNSGLNNQPPVPTYTYNWSPSTGLNTNTGDVVIATPATTTTYTVTVTDSKGATATDTKTIVVNKLASPVITVNGPTNVCPGSSVLLQADTSGAFTYQWYIMAFPIQNATSSTFNAVGSGPYAVQISSGTNCSVMSNNVIVNIGDSENPVALTQNISRTITSAGGPITITAADINNGSYDNCSIASMTVLGNATFDCSTTSGTYVVTLEVTDGSGNISTQDANINITNSCNTAPVAICKNISIAANGNSANVSASSFNNGSTDAENDALLFTVFPNGPYSLGTTNVVLTVTDPAGLSSSCNASITVIDSTIPTVITQNITATLDAIGSATITSAQVNNGSTDNVGVVSYALSNTTYNCNNLGLNSVTLTATDAAGNMGTGTATVTVVDAIAPTAIAQNFSVNLGANGTADIIAANINNGSSDNCSVASISIDKSSFNCSNLGANTVTLTVIDGSGNSSTAIAIVTVNDVTVPTVQAKNLVVQLNANGLASVTADQFNDGSFDNCAIANMSISKSTFDCTNVGANILTFTVTDGSGNFASTLVSVLVQDITKPIVSTIANQELCQDPSGLYTVPTITATDNCSVTTSYFEITGATTRFGQGLNASGAFALGTSTIKWTVKDAMNNTTTSTAIVTITAAPVASIVTTNVNSFCNEITLTANSNQTGNTSYAWSTGETTQSITLGISDPNGVYTVYVINQNGCNSALPASYNFNKQSVANVYTILAYDEVELKSNNNVVTGSVGVLTSKGEAEFERGVIINGPGAFAKAPKFDIKGTVTIPTRITGVVSVTLPTMQAYTGNTNGLPSYTINQNVTKVLNGNYKEVTIKKGANATLTGTLYDKITIEDGATVLITASTVNIQELKVGKGNNNALTRLKFAGNTSVRIQDKVKIEENCLVNPDHYSVTFYFANTSSCGDNDEDKFNVEGGNTSVIANVLIPAGKLKVKSESNNIVYMTGFFLGNRVQSQGKNVVWNNNNCNAPQNRDIVSELEPLTSVAETDFSNLVVFPNPANSVFNFKFESLSTESINFRIFDVTGRLVSEFKQSNANETYQTGDQLAPGVYMLEATQGTDVKVQRVVKTQ